MHTHFAVNAATPAAASSIAPTANAPALLTREQLLAMPESDYMNADQLAFFKDMLTRTADDLRKNDESHGAAMREHEMAADPVDRASQEETHSLGLITRGRETHRYQEVRQAIARIEKDEFGWCADTGEAIGVARLLVQPTATLTVDAQSRLETRSRTFAPA